MFPKLLFSNKGTMGTIRIQYKNQLVSFLSEKANSIVCWVINQKLSFQKTYCYKSWRWMGFRIHNLQFWWSSQRIPDQLMLSIVRLLHRNIEVRFKSKQTTQRINKQIISRKFYHIKLSVNQAVTINLFSANPIKWSNTLKKLVSKLARADK